jgi:L-ascorbate metabolism protein UlaG (beta-lactamase superfamily)
MRITRYGHSCLLVEHDDARVLLDPGVFSSGFEQLRGLTAVLVTHAHPDHLDVARLGALLEANPDARLHVDEGSAAQLDGLPAVVVHEGDVLDLGVRVEVHGSTHAEIHEDIPRIPNVGYLVGGRFFTPGDALTVPDADVEVLGLPTAAPWLKLSEAVGMLRAVAPRRAFPVHDAVLSQPQIWYGQFDALSPDGTSFEALAPDAVLELS